MPCTPPSSRLPSAALARLAGVSVDTLRHYEKKGLLAAAPPGERAGLLDALEDVIADGAVSPLVPEALARRR